MLKIAGHATGLLVYMITNFGKPITIDGVLKAARLCDAIEDRIQGKD